MATEDPRVDAYIANAADFAQPLLVQFRAAVRQACPEVVEAIKWRMPFFMHRGRMLAHMAAFKAHCAFDIHAGPASRDADKDGEAMGVFGRVTTRADLPSKAELVKRLKAGVAVIESGEKTARTPKALPRPPLETPPDLVAALVRNAPARKRFAAFSPSHRREYIEWLMEAKRPQTREKRLAQAIDQITEGKPRHWNTWIADTWNCPY